MIWFDLGCVYLVELPLGWHTDTYRMVSIGHGAFELCLPSLGILYQIYLLRTQYLGVGHRPGWSWGEDLRSMDRVTLSHACRIRAAARILPYRAHSHTDLYSPTRLVCLV